MLEIKFTADTASKLRADMLDFLNSMPAATAQVGIIHSAPMPMGAEIQSEPEAIEPRKRGRKAKEKILLDEAEVEESVRIKTEDVEEAAPAPTKPEPQTKDIGPGKKASGATKESVQIALQRVNAEVGLAKARDILHAFGINRISEIKPEHFDKFEEACLAAIET